MDAGRFIRIHILPGGVMPERKSSGAIGYDVCLRAIVSSGEMDPQNPYLRKTLFDFQNLPTDPEILKHITRVANGDGSEELVYRMEPGESVLGGIGFVTEMPFPVFYWVAPRSGLATKSGITVTNAPGMVDPDYRGEAGVLVLYFTNSINLAEIIFRRFEARGAMCAGRHMRDE